MPSPIDLLLDPVTLTSLAIYGALILWEALVPARTLPAVRGWRAKGVAAFLLFFMVSSYLPWLWADQLAAWQLLDLSGLNRWAGAAIALLVYEAGVYAWHRSMHGSPRLWRSFHQLHHSAERLDTFGLVQRPESHSHHHARDVHTGNFGDLPLTDIATEAS